MRRFIIPILVVVLGLLALVIWHNSTFRVVGVTPSLNKVSTVSPYIQIRFSQPVASSSLRLSSSSEFIENPKIDGKVVTIPLIVPLTSGQKYSLTIVSVSSVKGKTITSRVFKFTPTYIPSALLPKNEQDALLKNESRPGPNYINFDQLTNFGFDQNQVTNVELELKTYQPSLKQAVINPSSLTIGKYDPNDPNAHAPILFNLSLDGRNYGASVLGNDTTDDVLVTLTNTTSGAQVFQGNSATK